MPLLAAILGAVIAAAVWYWRLRAAGMAARELTGMAADVLGAARALGFRRRANVHPVDSVEDPALAVAAIGIAFLELDGLPSREDQQRLARSIGRHTDNAMPKTEEMMIVGRWLVNECHGAQPAISRLTRRLARLDAAGFQPLLSVLNDVAQGAGGMSEKQRESLDEIGRLMKLR